MLISIYTDVTERSPIDRRALHLFRACTLPPPAHFPKLPSVHANVGNGNHVTNFASYKRFGLADICRWGNGGKYDTGQDERSEAPASLPSTALCQLLIHSLPETLSKYFQVFS
jgi:hypothetical protein